MKLDSFFPTSRNLIALPNWKSPHLVLSDYAFNNVNCYKGLYPASTFLGKLHKEILFWLAGLGLAPTRNVIGNSLSLEKFIGSSFNGIYPTAMVIGTPGKTQKFTIQLCDKTRSPVAYIKYAENPLAINRLKQEYRMLSLLPIGIAPQPIKMEAIFNGMGLLMSSVNGDLVKPNLDWPIPIKTFISKLRREHSYLVTNHPWIKRLINRYPECKGCLNSLMGRFWPVVFLHGDLAPWNLLVAKDKVVQAIDWESSETEGFPYIDLIYYFLRVAALVRKMSPRQAAMAVQEKMVNEFPEISIEEAKSLVKLTALFSYDQRVEEQRGNEDYLMNWYQQVY